MASFMDDSMTLSMVSSVGSSSAPLTKTMEDAMASSMNGMASSMDPYMVSS